MEALRVGGIISGLDTNGIVETYSKQARLPLDRLDRKYEIKNVERSVYSSVDSQMDEIKKNLLNLRLESTFKTKSLTSTNSSILNATASVTAEPGSYSVQVMQTASQAYWTSHFTSIAGVTTGGGVDSLSGSPTEHLEGSHDIAVDVSSDPKTVTDTFTPNNLGTLTKVTGTGNISNLDADGELTAGLAGDFSVTIDSVTFTTTVGSGAGEAGESGNDINEVMNHIEIDLNNQLNTHFGTTDLHYVAMRADYSGGNWNTAMYKTSLESFDVSVNNTGIAGDLGAGTTATSTSNTITKYYVDADAGDLLTKVNDSGSAMIRGVNFVSADGLEDGSLELIQDSSLNTSKSTPTTRTGTTVSSGSGIDTTILGLENAGFLQTVDSSLNGTFTINDTEITIDDFAALTVNDVLAKINGSGAGVTATYDSANDKMVLTSNTPGSSTISLGQTSDTSDFFDVFRLSSSAGATTSTGNTEGQIIPSEKLSSAGFSNTITSGVFTINDTPIYIDAATDSLNDVIEKVNSSGAGVTLAYDENRDRLTIKSDTKDQISFGAATDTSSFLSAVKLTDSPTTKQSLGYSGQDSIIKVDGITYLRDSNTVDDVITGITLNLNSVSSETVNLNVEIDTDKSINAVATFIQQYNTLMEKLDPPEIDSDNEQYLTPLTSDEKASMSTDEIESFNEKFEMYTEYNLIAKSSELRSLRSSLRDSLTGTLSGVDSSFLNLSSMGLDVAGGLDFAVLNKGLLVVDSTDKDTIIEALEDNNEFVNNLTNSSNDIYKFFSQNDGEADDLEGKGWARRYELTINSFTADDASIGIKLKAGGTIDTDISRLLEDYTSQESRVEQYLERLWSQFTAMETTIASLQDQGNTLAGLTSSGS